MPTTFNPPVWLRNPHLQTILPKFLVKYKPNYTRKLVKDSLDQSDVAYDYLLADAHRNAEGKYTTPAVVLFHGMEGSSDSHYARTLARCMHAAGLHFVVAHFRSCGGVPVAGEVLYNAGDTTEVHHNLTNLHKEFESIYAIGVSLGGNALAKYMGEYADQAICKKAVIVSAPVDLSSSSIAMERFISKRVYTPYLLNPIVKKALENRLTPDEITALKAAKRMGDFDDVITAPRHGYRSKNDYYRQASALPYLCDITKPTLLITAKDDPFLGLTATTRDVSKSVTVLDTKHGGHIGFLDYNYRTRKFDLDFVPRTALVFFGLDGSSAGLV